MDEQYRRAYGEDYKEQFRKYLGYDHFDRSVMQWVRVGSVGGEPEEKGKQGSSKGKPQEKSKPIASKGSSGGKPQEKIKPKASKGSGGAADKVATP